jgi:polysaccharide export outer membrane protein
MRAITLYTLAALAAASPVRAQVTGAAVAPPAADATDSTAAAAQRAARVAIAVGDRVAINVWREPWFSDSTLVVDERGDVVLARVGTVRVAGRSIADVQDTLRLRFAEYLRNPSVRVTVFRRIGVQGEVKEPNLYYVDVTMTLREVLALAGGVAENGNPNDIVIVREGRQIALGQWRRGGPLSAELQSGDQIVVGRRSWLSRNALAVVSTAGLVLSVLLPVLRDK